METQVNGPVGQVSASGLEGVIVANTALSHVDGERGVLIVAGEDIEVMHSRCSSAHKTPM